MTQVAKEKANGDLRAFLKNACIVYAVAVGESR